MKTLYVAILLCFLSLQLSAQNAFITTWQTTAPGESITIPTINAGYDYSVDWGDGATDTGVTGAVTHSYTSAGTYVVSITGDFPRIYFGGSSKIQTIEQWGDIKWTSMFNAFPGCQNLTYNATDAPDLTLVTSMRGMFSDSDLFNGDLSSWDVSKVTDMRGMFAGADAFNGDLSSWDVSKVTDMAYMFRGAFVFNQDLSNWNVSQVTDMEHMFEFAISFNGDISNWDVGQVTDMGSMFQETRAFNQDLSNWDVSQVTDMNSMFESARAFNQDLSNWDVSKVTSMRHMFYKAPVFNGDLSGWNPSQVTDMSRMFWDANAFNQDLSSWDVSKVTNMDAMFQTADVFNGDLSGWNPSQVTNMHRMFSSARAFNGDLSGWDVSQVTNMYEMFNGAVAFNQDLSSWDVSQVTDMNSMFANATVFNQDLSNWDVSQVTTMQGMFGSAIAFNGNLSGWDVSQVTNMRAMFSGTAFNGDLSGWDVSQVTNMKFMFINASAFNQDLSSWDVSQVTEMGSMFINASAFNQNLSSWDVSQVTDMSGMLDGSGMLTDNYDALLSEWAKLSLQSGVTLGVQGLTYCNGSSPRSVLTGSNGWSIVGDAISCDPEIIDQEFAVVENSAISTLVGTVDVSNPRGDTPVFSIKSGNDAGVFALDGNSGELTIANASNLNYETVIPFEFELEIEVNVGTFDLTAMLRIHLQDENEAPELILIGDKAIDEEVSLAFMVLATDEDLPANTLTYSLDATSIASGMSIDGGTGEFSWLPSESQDGVHQVTFAVSDGGLQDTETIMITVNEVNIAPVLSVEDKIIPTDSPYTYMVLVTDTDLPVNTLTYSLDATSISSGMSIDSGTGEFSWTPSESQDGAHQVTFTVSDGSLQDTETITITAVVNIAPELSNIGDQSTDEEVSLAFTVSATDADLLANTLTFSLDANSIASGMNIDGGTGEFSWTPSESQDGAHQVTFTVSDGSLQDTETITITVNEVNIAPELSNIGDQSIDEEELLDFTVSATDEDLSANTLTYSLDATSIASGMGIDSETGEFSWTPSESQDGAHQVTFTVSDGSLQDTETITITVNEVNIAPELSNIGDQSTDEEELLDFTVSATDADLLANTLTFSLDANSIASGMNIDGGTGEFSWTPSEIQDGTHQVTFTVSDGSLQDTETITITVNEVNIAPELSNIGDQSTDEEELLDFTVSATDTDLPANTLAYSLDPTSIASGMGIDSETGEFSWTPSESQDGAHQVTFTVSDGSLQDTETITITVNEVNIAPELSNIGDQSTDEEELLDFTVSATDADLSANTLTYSLDATSIALGMGIDSETGEFSWTPSESQDGAHQVTFTVSDGGLEDTETITITVNEVNIAPELSNIGDQSTDEEELLDFTVSATDTDLPANTLVYSLDATSIASGMSIDSETGEFSWTPSEIQDGAHQVTITVSDGSLEDTETITITVNEVDNAPELSNIGDQSTDEEVSLAFTVSATDEGLTTNTLTYSLDATSITSGMSIDSETGEFSWTPSEIQDGTHQVTITVSDGDLEDTETITITVNEVNIAPELSNIGDQSTDEEVSLAFTVSATDADLAANTLVYSLDATSIASGMSIDSETGEFSWTPSEGQDGSHQVTITVSDGSLEDTETITITVNEVDNAPILSNIGDQSTDEEVSLAFTVSATDEGLTTNTLTYSLDATSIASGMSIDSGTGEFSWTPSESQDGAHQVTFTVSDGSLQDTETITITVNEVNIAPELSNIGDKAIDEEVSLAFTISATDEDLPANTLTYSLDATSIASGMSIDGGTGEFSWLPSESQDGSHQVTITVSDGSLEDTEIITITVNEVNSAPVLSAIGDLSIDEGIALSFSSTATDGDLPANTLTYSLDATSVAAGMVIDGSTGAFNWTPNENQIGAHVVTVTVSDGSFEDAETITITVVPIEILAIVDGDNSNFSIYPNPVTNVLHISGVSINRIRVFNLLGSEVEEITMNKERQGVVINTSHLIPGVYTITITTKNAEILSRKFIK